MATNTEYETKTNEDFDFVELCGLITDDDEIILDLDKLENKTDIQQTNDYLDLLTEEYDFNGESVLLESAHGSLSFLFD